MAVNHETLSEFEVVTAEWAQEHLMDQVIPKADLLTDLTGLPNEVKAAYVLEDGQLYIRDDLNNWKRGGGAAEVGTTAPSNPATGQLWVNPDEVFPLPVRVNLRNGISSVTATSWGTQLPSSSTADFVNGTGKAIMCQINYSAWVNVVQGASGSGDVRQRLVWTGALSGNSYDHVGGWNGVAYAMAGTSQLTYVSVGMNFSLILPNGTTTFKIEAYKNGTPSTSNVNYPGLGITPVAWADEYADGVS